MADNELSKEEEKMDWYGVLSIDVAATEKDINKSFKKLSLVWHPDKNGGSEEAHAKFMKIKEAKLFLLDGKKRKLYDQKRAARHKTEALLVSRVSHRTVQRHKTSTAAAVVPCLPIRQATSCPPARFQVDEATGRFYPASVCVSDARPPH